MNLLVMPCSAKKHPRAGLMPANRRYQGSAWHTLHSNRGAAELEVIILSAAHAFLPEAAPIASYDNKMTPARALEVPLDITAMWFRDRVANASGRIFLMGSKLYRSAMVDAIGAVDVMHLVAAGRLSWPGDGVRGAAGIGEQLAALKGWLHLIRQDLSC